MLDASVVSTLLPVTGSALDLNMRMHETQTALSFNLILITSEIKSTQVTILITFDKRLSNVRSYISRIYHVYTCSDQMMPGDIA